MGAFNSQQNAAFAGAQGDLSQYAANVQKLQQGQNVGANPYQSTAYLSNVNKLQSESLNNAANSGKAQLQRWNVATGGLNRSQVPLAMRDITLQTGRLADTLSAQRAANDYRANLQWQQYLAGAPLSAAQLQSGIYGTAARGSSDALNAYTQAQNNVWNNVTGIGESLINSGTKLGTVAMMS
jgi:hypothetical protein